MNHDMNLLSIVLHTIQVQAKGLDIISVTPFKLISNSWLHRTLRFNGVISDIQQSATATQRLTELCDESNRNRAISLVSELFTIRRSNFV